MSESFATILAVGGKLNTLGRAAEVVQTVLDDKSRLDELFECLFHEDSWLRMRAVDSLEKVCRQHPEWLLPYVERLFDEVAPNDQPSIQWHLAELFNEIDLTPQQRQRAIDIMKRNVATVDADWIVASNTMKTLVDYVHAGHLQASDVIPLLRVQQKHHSNAVTKRATKYLNELES